MALPPSDTNEAFLREVDENLRRDRLRDAVLLKTLGATRAQIGRILLAEYAVLGALGAVAGMLLSFAGAWGLPKGCAIAAALKASLSACSASLVSPDTVRTPLLPGIFMRLYAG